MIKVRCCCQPKKVLGWFDWEYMGQTSYRFALPSHDIWNASHSILELPVAKFRGDDGQTEYALKSEETPIETLRKIAGFIEND